jgi:signal peptidase I
MNIADLTQRLADLHVSTIVWFVAVLTVARIGMVRFQAPAVRAVVEIVEAALIASVLVFMLIQPFLVKAFYIPSGSMIPTLVEDDHILVNKLEYRLEPKHRGDVIVFVAPPQALKVNFETPSPDGDPYDYIKRLIGMPGDIIQVVRGYVKVGDKVETHEDIAKAFDISDENHGHVKFEDHDVRVFDDKAQTWTTYSEQDIAQKVDGYATPVEIHPGYVLRNGVKLVEPYIAEDPDYDMKVVNGHSVLNDPTSLDIKVDGESVSPDEANALENSPPGPVPPGYVFAMGDNRNQSSDCTRWGPLDEKRIVGKAFFIFYPFGRVRVVH